MAPPPAKRIWRSLAWLRRFSWPAHALFASMLVTIAIALVFSDSAWIPGALFVAFAIPLNVVVYRQGGWGLLGPHFYYDVIRLARRGRSTVVRVLFIVALFVGLAIVFYNTPLRQNWGPNDFARVSERFTFTLFLVQNIAIVILAPAYLGSAIAEERERRTLELLFTTHLSNTEIILGKLTSRVIHLIGFVLAGLPILSLVQFWGGIDIVMIAGNLLNTILNILSIGSICLLCSVLARTVTGAVMTSYAGILPIVSCCGGVLHGFPFVLQDARTAGGGTITVQAIGILCLVHLVIVVGFLALSIAALRETEPLGSVLPPTPQRLDIPEGPRALVRPAPVRSPLRVTAIQVKSLHTPPPDLDAEIDPPRRRGHSRPVEPENEFSIPYTLPPVTDHALMWKERYVGGPPWFFSPVILVPALPFLVTAVLVLGFWFVRSLFLNQDEFRRAVEAWSIVLRVLYYACLTAYVLGVGFRAASSVARERQQQTLDPLLLLPIDRSEILRAKLIGSLWRGWPWLALMAGNIALGTLLGAYHPFSAVFLCIAPWALILFIAGLGLLASVHLSTVLRANMVLLVGVMLLVAASLLLPVGLSPLTYIEPFAFPLWPEIQPDFFLDPMRSVMPALRGAIVFVLYLGAASVLLWTAFVQFENRVRQPES